ncbi:MAG: hypothetical protein ACRDIY_13830 [Chloroflexota bacterium]
MTRKPRKSPPARRTLFAPFVVFRDLRGPNGPRGPDGSGSPDGPLVPDRLRRWLTDHSLDSVAAIGNPEILRTKRLALFCSRKCPGDLILRTYDLALALREGGAAVVGGFHAPMEHECLAFLLRGESPIVVCPARALEGMRVPTEWRKPLADGRLLALSPFANWERRPTAALAQTRNELVAALAHEVLVVHAEPGGGIERLCRTVLAWGKPLLTLESPANAQLVALGARVVDIERLREIERASNNQITGGGASS